ncbi:RsmB/NOP family class I SAM-dependent RNA methyltransferase [Allonocardiopsis opalescens]|uniref:16S rRNA (Cytosine967-C5)-methyltransferase n=1 Tax=Allonocardiopsis opalescens TaxID=1144618 RepID=A0A2T0Q3Q2_9ACTN|nr:transcription antitermination factor NusB [Allonocardiopsis opalescens]PRX98435.1 16S rRNA (cytosine967-C5)-methyltransferase [Allonocardiopsis opalescens]
MPSSQRPRRPAGAGRPTGRGRTGGQPPRDPARRVAFDVLRAVDDRDAYANLLLPAMLTDRRVSGRDAALATELTYGTLRGSGSYDAVLDACTDRPIGSVDAPVRDVLRLGTHQLLATRIPPHAAVSASVDLARRVAGAGPARFVNAVLRKVAARDLAAWLRIVAPDPAADPVGHLAVTRSHPRWIVTALAEALGDDLAAPDPAHSETARLLAAHNERPAVTLVAKPGRAPQAELIQSGAVAARYSPIGGYLPEGDPHAIPAVRQGRVAVQDEASQLVALTLAAAPLDGPDRRWLDLCAGPGGKASVLAGLAGQRDARLLAAEIQPHRAALVAAAVARSVRGAGRALVADGTRPAWADAAFDRVLVDAPCTGLGALRRRPEARWRRTPDDLATLVPLQRRLLARALDAVRPGGVVAYATCSPHLDEGPGAVDAVLAERSDATVLDARAALAEVAAVPELPPGPHVQFWPHRHGTDALFLALLRRS